MFKHRANEKTVDDNDEENLDDDDDQSEANVLCDNCEFLTPDDLSLEVHYERKHSGYYDCAFCAFRAENEENLNIHLFTCETFTCEHCDPKVMVKTLPDMKAHLTTQHKEKTNIVHLKLDRSNVDKVSRRTVSSEYLSKN